MAVRTGQDATGKFPYAEIDAVNAGDTYVVRVTAIPPYRNNVTDELICHVDWNNITAGTSGRYANIVLPAKQGREGRRGPMLRLFAQNRGRGISTPSPVFP